MDMENKDIDIVKDKSEDGWILRSFYVKEEDCFYESAKRRCNGRI